MSAMTETAARIRWEDSHNNPGEPAFIGHVRSLDDLFRIWPPEEPGDEWLLNTCLPGMVEKEWYGFPDDLKIEAERWLGEFTASLGAVFGDAVAADLRSRADEMESYAGGGEEGRHDRSMFATGMRRSAALIEHGDVPATSAPVAADGKE